MFTVRPCLTHARRNDRECEADDITGIADNGSSHDVLGHKGNILLAFFGNNSSKHMFVVSETEVHSFKYSTLTFFHSSSNFEVPKQWS